MKYMFAIALCFATNAYAHFQIGTYNGTSNDGLACAFEIKSVHFKNDLRHPLNEIVVMDLDFLQRSDVTFTHLAIVDAETGTVRPKPEILTAVDAFSGGAAAVELFMDDNGPQKIVAMRDNYKSPSLNTKVTCKDLIYAGK